MSKKIEDISVVIPTSRADEKTIKAVNSVINQSVKAKQIIVVFDNISKISQQSFMNKYSKTKNIYFYSIKKGSPAKTRNYGAKKAHCKYLAFLDCDDLWYPEKIEMHLEFMRKENLDCSFTDLKYEKENKFKLNSEKELNINSVISGKINGFNPSVIMLTNLFFLIGGYNESLRYKEDHYFLLELLFFNAKIKVCPMFLTIVNTTKNSGRSNKKFFMILKNHIRFIKDISPIVSNKEKFVVVKETIFELGGIFLRRIRLLK